MVQVLRPGSKDAVSVRKISQTAEDRKRQLSEFKEQKQYENKLKQERFEKIKETRKKRTSGGRKGINVEIKGGE